jgi:hypothetical protein
MSIWTEINKQSTSWTEQDKETTLYRDLNTFKEIVFNNSYDDSLGYEEIFLSNAIDNILYVKTLNLSRISWIQVS